MTTQMTTQKISVTSDDIKNGAKGISTSCAVALAIRRVFPECLVTVTMHRCRVQCGEKVRVYNLPREVTRFINIFDEGEYVDEDSYIKFTDLTPEPMEFEATLFEEYEIG